ncbi:hypothetical protein TNCV_4615271 [Trichonephila clavipes]|nr:hypothetical protein TNCV_4615271 [Trichonephila clavipes]
MSPEHVPDLSIEFKLGEGDLKTSSAVEENLYGKHDTTVTVAAYFSDIMCLRSNWDSSDSYASGIIDYGDIVVVIPDDMATLEES